MSKLSRKIAQQTDVSEADVRTVLNCMTEYLASELRKGNKVSIPSVCSMEPYRRASHSFCSVYSKQMKQSEPKQRVKASVYDSFLSKVYGKDSLDGT